MRRILIIAALLAGLLAPAIAHSALGPNPANEPQLLNKPIEEYRYDHGRKCRDNPYKGTKALEKWLGRHVRGESWGIMRCEKLSKGNYSLHAEGRAIDWHLDARNRKDKRAAKQLIHMLLERDKHGNKAALARRMGVQGIIFNCRSWWSGMEQMETYSYCEGSKPSKLDPTAAHVDHVHLELNLPGARERTSFWRSPLSRR